MTIYFILPRRPLRYIIPATICISWKKIRENSGKSYGWGLGKCLCQKWKNFHRRNNEHAWVSGLKFGILVIISATAVLPSPSSFSPLPQSLQLSIQLITSIFSAIHCLLQCLRSPARPARILRLSQLGPEDFLSRPSLRNSIRNLGPLWTGQAGEFTARPGDLKDRSWCDLGFGRSSVPAPSGRNTPSDTLMII